MTSDTLTYIRTLLIVPHTVYGATFQFCVLNILALYSNLQMRYYACCYSAAFMHQQGVVHIDMHVQLFDAACCSYVT